MIIKITKVQQNKLKRLRNRFIKEIGEPIFIHDICGYPAPTSAFIEYNPKYIIWLENLFIDKKGR